jgi:hypothetical protein
LELTAFPSLPTWLNWKDPSMRAHTLQRSCFLRLPVSHTFREKISKSDFFSMLGFSPAEPFCLINHSPLFCPNSSFVFSRFQKTFTLFVSYSFFSNNEYFTRGIYQIPIPQLPDYQIARSLLSALYRILIRIKNINMDINIIN